MSTWQSHWIDDRPAQVQHLGELHEIAEEEEESVFHSSGVEVHPDGFVEYECGQCGDWCLRDIQEPCTHHGECLGCYTGVKFEIRTKPERDHNEPIPPEVPWSEFRAYQCKVCREDCLNWDGLACTKEKECRQCYAVPDLSQSPSPTASEGEGGEARHRAGLSRPEGAAERPEAGSEPTDAQRGLAPDRGARAPLPNPKGEGGTRKRSATSESESSGPGQAGGQR